MCLVVIFPVSIRSQRCRYVLITIPRRPITRYIKPTRSCRNAPNLWDVGSISWGFWYRLVLPRSGTKLHDGIMRRGAMSIKCLVTIVHAFTRTDSGLLRPRSEYRLEEHALLWVSHHQALANAAQKRNSLKVAPSTPFSDRTSFRCACDRVCRSFTATIPRFPRRNWKKGTKEREGVYSGCLEASVYL